MSGVGSYMSSNSVYPLSLIITPPPPTLTVLVVHTPYASISSRILRYRGMGEELLLGRGDYLRCCNSPKMRLQDLGLRIWKALIYKLRVKGVRVSPLPLRRMTTCTTCWITGWAFSKLAFPFADACTESKIILEKYVMLVLSPYITPYKPLYTLYTRNITPTEPLHNPNITPTLI